jgi:5-(carboxyamino)imidazole ribonucleotide mutase
MTVTKPLVRVILGSRSDTPQGDKIKETLEIFGIPYDFYFSSAHRQPEQTANLARQAESEGIELFICAAGMAAHLPGVVAAFSTLPVIGVPLKGPNLGGEDALYSVVQMPTGIPVACVAIDGGKNAAVLAARILALKYPEIKIKLLSFQKSLAE